jgi:hypothetical protein
LSLPELCPNGLLPPGIHAASLAEVVERFGSGSAARVRSAELLKAVVRAAIQYETIKRILIWGSFVTAKPEPNDLDYTAIVGIDFRTTILAREHLRFLSPRDARAYYGVDRSYVVISDYPIDFFVEKLDFVTTTRDGIEVGVVEISVRGEVSRERQ